MSLMEVEGVKQAAESKDASKKITIGLWKFQIPNPENHPSFQVDVTMGPGQDWVCIGGGAIGNPQPGNFLTMSRPSLDLNGKEDWKGWAVATRDHEVANPCKLVGVALGMKVDGLSREELISNLKIFTELDANPASHTELSCYVEDGFLLLGGGFEVLDQDGGGNMATASFPNSNYSWMARSRDEDIPTPSRLRVFAIGISANLMKPNPTGQPTSIGNVETTFASSESLASWASMATQRPLPGYALCGGGACAHFGMVRGETYADLQVDRNAPMFIWGLDPMISAQPPPTAPDQSFTGNSFMHMRPCVGTITAYAMGIKFKSTVEPVT